MRVGKAAAPLSSQPRQVGVARALAAERGLSRAAKFTVADGAATPFPSGHFGLAVSIESAAYMPDKMCARTYGGRGTGCRARAAGASCGFRAAKRGRTALMRAWRLPLTLQCRRFMGELARLLEPGGKLLLADFCAAADAGALTERQRRSLRRVDAAFGSAGDWCTAEGYRELMGACLGGGVGRAHGTRATGIRMVFISICLWPPPLARRELTLAKQTGPLPPPKPCLHVRRARPSTIAEECGLQVVAEADYTGRLRGFWDLGAAEALLRRDAEAEGESRRRGPLGDAAVFASKARRAAAGAGGAGAGRRACCWRDRRWERAWANTH
jgi:hypothetical protein